MAEQIAVPRGVRNNNPGNIRRPAGSILRHVALPWRGVTLLQPDPEFITFQAPEWGIRAIVVTLLTYERKYGLHTADAMIARWAPPKENRTGDYAHFVDDWLHLPPFTQIHMANWSTARAIATGIIAEECSRHTYPEIILSRGLFLAGIQEPASSAVKAAA